jgi:endonuclease/exonuclease/phosphatase family metal-dependent hydrolase
MEGIYVVMGRRACTALSAIIGFSVVLVPTAASGHTSRPGESAHARAGSGSQAVTVMTYNIKRAALDGHPEGGTRVAAWMSARRLAAAALIQRANPDVIGIEEGGTSIGNPQTGPRQVDTLASALGHVYQVAHTEIPPKQPGTQRLGVYIMYKKSVYAAVGKGGHWALGDGRWGVHQVLRNRQSGAKFLFVTAHLWEPGGRTNDIRREHETQRLESAGNAMAARRGIPAIYVGDFNSHPGGKHAFNAPSMVMGQHGLRDSFQVAHHRVNGAYNTGNQYMRRPPRFGAHIDYIYVPQSVRVTSWRMVMRLNHGQFVGTIPSDHNPVVANLAVPIR